MARHARRPRRRANDSLAGQRQSLSIGGLEARLAALVFRLLLSEVGALLRHKESGPKQEAHGSQTVGMAALASVHASLLPAANTAAPNSSCLADSTL